MAAALKNKPRKVPPMRKGTLVMWNDQKGFGFIHPDGSDEDYFVHISTFKKGMTRRPESGDIVHFRPDESAGKKRASFAMIPELDHTAHNPPQRFSLNPRKRSWDVNLLIALPLVLSGYLLIITKNPVPFIAYWILSLLTMFLYGIDKAHAATHRWRVPEIYLHLTELLGGWPGALIAQNDFRHKTRQSVYLWILRGIIAIHVMAWIIYFYWTSRPPAMGLY